MPHSSNASRSRIEALSSAGTRRPAPAASRTSHLASTGPEEIGRPCDHARDAALDNAAAIRTYEKVGFKPVGVLRSAWRDPGGTLRDVMLMDILASELPAPEGGSSAS